MRQFRLYKITISRRTHIRGTSQMPDEIDLQPSATYYALTLYGLRRKAQRKVEQLNSRDGLHVPIARTVEGKPRVLSRHFASHADQETVVQGAATAMINYYRAFVATAATEVAGALRTNRR